MGAYFDIVSFLGLDELAKEKREKLRPLVLADLTSFILAKFADGVSEDKLDEVARRVKNLKGYEEVMALIYQFDPDFETKKIKWLEEYKKDFELEKFELGEKK